MAVLWLDDVRRVLEATEIWWLLRILLITWQKKHRCKFFFIAIAIGSWILSMIKSICFFLSTLWKCKLNKVKFKPSCVVHIYISVISSNLYFFSEPFHAGNRIKSVRVQSVLARHATQLCRRERRQRLPRRRRCNQPQFRDKPGARRWRFKQFQPPRCSTEHFGDEQQAATRFHGCGYYFVGGQRGCDSCYGGDDDATAAVIGAARAAAAATTNKCW